MKSDYLHDWSLIGVFIASIHHTDTDCWCITNVRGEGGRKCSLQSTMADPAPSCRHWDALIIVRLVSGRYFTPHFSPAGNDNCRVQENLTVWIQSTTLDGFAGLCSKCIILLLLISKPRSNHQSNWDTIKSWRLEWFISLKYKVCAGWPGVVCLLPALRNSPLSPALSPSLSPSLPPTHLRQ